MTRKTAKIFVMSLITVFLTTPLEVSAWQDPFISYAIPIQTPQDGLDYS